MELKELFTIEVLNRKIRLNISYFYNYKIWFSKMHSDGNYRYDITDDITFFNCNDKYLLFSNWEKFSSLFEEQVKFNNLLFYTPNYIIIDLPEKEYKNYFEYHNFNDNLFDFINKFNKLKQNLIFT